MMFLHICFFIGLLLGNGLAKNPCDSNPCENNGKCLMAMSITMGRTYRCICVDGVVNGQTVSYIGRNCEKVDPCKPNPCQNNGECNHINDGDDYECKCMDKVVNGETIVFTGKDCDKVDDEASTCFPGDALVTMESGMKRMEDVVQGDRVLARTSDGSLGYSDVVMVMHGDSHVTHKFYIIHTDLESVQLRLTAEHMLFSQGPSDKEPFSKMARNVQIGDFVFAASKGDKFNLQKSQVMNITQATFKGVYAPVTLEGTIIVDDVLASCYAYVEYQDAVHAIFWPVRALYKWFPMSVGQWKETKDIHWYPSILDTVFMPMLNTISVQ